MEAGHDGADRDVEDLRRVLVGEVADVDEHDHVAEVVRHGRERRDDVVLRQPLDDRSSSEAGSREDSSSLL